MKTHREFEMDKSIENFLICGMWYQVTIMDACLSGDWHRVADLALRENAKILGWWP